MTALARGVEERPAPASTGIREHRSRRALVTGPAAKFTLFVGLLLIAFAAALGAINIPPQEKIGQEQLRQKGEAIVTMLASVAGGSARSGGDLRELADIVGEVARQQGVLYVSVRDGDGKLIVGSEPSGPDASSADAVDRRASRNHRHAFEAGDDGVYLSAPVEFRPGLTGTVSVGLSHEDMRAHLARLRERTLLLTISFLATGVLLTYLLMRRITARSRDELRHLADDCNRMRDRLDATTVSRDYLTEVLQSMPEALVVLGSNGRIRLANRAMCRLIGYADSDLSGMPFERLLAGAHGSASRLDITGRLQRDGVLNHIEASYLHSSGHPIAVLVSGALMRDAAGHTQAMICIAQDNRERKQHEEQIRQLAYFDTITGLPNRVQFHHALDMALQDCRLHGTKLGVLFLDLNRFKRINDTLGHAKGDHLLEMFAQRLAGCVRPSDTIARAEVPGERSTVARLGGDEFTILLRQIESSDDAARIARRILAALNMPFDLGGHEVVVDASIGIALYPDDGGNAEALLMHADLAMYHAKARGRAHFQFYHPELNAKAMERLWLESELRRALQLDQLTLEYQPQLDLLSDRVIGVEALLRWHHPERGRIPPDDFIPLAEESGLIGPIGAWVLSTACQKAKNWLDQGCGEIRVAVNISSEQLRQADFVGQVARALADSGLPSRLLELEITESAAMAEPEIMVPRLTELKRMGVDLAIDDFGTGYSSLACLQRFPLDRLKIDRSFIRHIVSSTNDAGIVTAIIAMAHQLGFEVIAEGVETQEQLAFLRDHGCDQMQGYFASAPLTAERFAAWLHARDHLVRAAS